MRNNRKEGKKAMHRETISFVLSILATIVSLASFIISFLSLKINQAEYEYKIGPKFVVTADLRMESLLVNGIEKRVPLLRSFHVRVIDENNLDRLYMIDPKLQVTEIGLDDLSGNMENYFAESIGTEGLPDYVDLETDTYYYYRFLVLKGLNETTDIRVLIFKTVPIDKETKSAAFETGELTNVQIMEYEKSHLDDPRYAGERQIAAQYREIREYLDP